MAVGEPEQEAEQEGNDEGVDELGTTAITIPKSDHRGQQHGRAEQGNQQTDDTNDAQNLHSGSLFRLKRAMDSSHLRDEGIPDPGSGRSIPVRYGPRAQTPTLPEG